MQAFHQLMDNMAALAARMDVLCAQQAQMSAMRAHAGRLHKLLCCAGTAQALAADLVGALGSAERARGYLDELRGECDGVFDALAAELQLQEPSNHEGRHD